MTKYSEQYNKYLKLIEVCKVKDTLIKCVGEEVQLEALLGAEKTEKIINIILDTAVQIYMKYIEPKEVEAILSFYESTTGQKLINIQADMIIDMRDQLQPKLESLIEESI
jgi:hypothetical protein